ncbi:hypothetical protein CANARDRAFT_29079 [[Candida] arabinofermentans NRRL YB-2248]|uniref:Cell wall mannoprotein PIR1-like C-terminal domain-containing protein n=1 Tax=[Candida] arabinofermentans NRRL YB-2248 TaxID=983967 RepID=A0A1E4SYI5_9ASCO|nr:hypothetical protein CANARDRAFT_29079 [[Candida] arabinofermentans NRRL YB-2248]
MQLSKSILLTLASCLLTKASASTSGYVVGDVWSTLSPSASLLEGASTSYPSTFGIAIEVITSSVSLTAASDYSEETTTKKAQVVTQIGDGQIQASTATATPSTTTHSSIAVVTQIADGQIQAVKKTAVVSQIGDGQIQATATTTTSEGTTTYTKETTVVTTDIDVVLWTGESSSQDETTTLTVTPTTTVAVTNVPSYSSSSDDITTTLTITPTTLVIVTVTDNSSSSSTQESSTSTSTSSSKNEKRDTSLESCLTDTSLALTLNGSILLDSAGRVGSIVSNRQFQFDGPPPQAGAIYAAGWSVVDGKLALGNQTEFYQCLSGNFYNLYDSMIAVHCEAVKLNVVDLVTC